MTSPQPGTLAGEAALLLDAIAARIAAARPAGSVADGTTPTTAGTAGSETDDAEPAHGPGTPATQSVCPECGRGSAAADTVAGAAAEPCAACPLCRLLAVIRGERPEVTARWMDSALTVVQTLRSMIPDPVSASPAPADQSAAGGLEPIDIR